MGAALPALPAGVPGFGTYYVERILPQTIRLDVLYGFTCVWPELGCRLVADDDIIEGDYCVEYDDRPGAAIVDEQTDEECSHQTPALILEDSNHDALAAYRADEDNPYDRMVGRA